jgi:hypothetical protein
MINSHPYAPIVYFCYNRPEHTLQSLNAIKRARYADQTDLYVFIDGPKSKCEELNVQRVSAIVCNIDGFRSKIITQHSENKGLCKNITDGITTVIKEHGRVIVIEDDVIISRSFLIYINEALNLYEKMNKVWHISGFNEYIGLDDKQMVFLQRNMRCWGWATWQDRWEYFKKDTDLIIATFSKKDIYKFNLDGCDNLYSQIIANHNNEIDTWAVFWYATIFKKNGLCLNPVISLTQNIGFDGSGVHCGFDDGKHFVKYLNYSEKFNFPTELVEDKEIFKRIKIHFLNQKKMNIKRFFRFFLRIFKKIR